MAKKHPSFSVKLQGLYLFFSIVKQNHLALIFLLIALYACSSFNDSVNKLVLRENYREALTLLEKNGVGTSPIQKPKPEYLQARTAYENAINQKYTGLTRLRGFDSSGERFYFFSSMISHGTSF